MFAKVPCASYTITKVSYVYLYFSRRSNSDQDSMFYHVATILLHRPFRTNNECRSLCRKSAAEVEHLLLLLDTSIGLTHVTYIMAYCAYTAATVAMLDLHDGVEGSHARVNTFLRALYGLRKSCPGIQRSIDIIIKGLDYSQPTKHLVSTQSGPDGRLDQPDPLPAFPFHEYLESNEWNAVSQENLPFGSLDPYAIDWTQIADEFVY